MEKSEIELQYVFDELHQFSITDKTKFLEVLLFYFTLAGRGIWSDSVQADTAKVNAFKWMNELLHRIWTIHFELHQGKDHDSIKRLFENMTLYGAQSDLLSMHLQPTILGALETFRKDGNQDKPSR
ncbi:hypothetical protein [Ferruginibacter sp.]|nr:hypothetical protein [Ferruginibacter sp.]